VNNISHIVTNTPRLTKRKHHSQLKRFVRYTASSRKYLVQLEQKRFENSLQYIFTHHQRTICTIEERILNRSGSVFGVKMQKWYSQYLKLCHYHIEYHRLQISNYFPDLDLITWIQRQRSVKEYLFKEQLLVLDSIGFIWDIRSIRFTEKKGLDFAKEVTQTV
jgi:hypothetical protein